MKAENGSLSDAELAAFADGSLPLAERERVAVGVERSPDLQALVDEQRAAIVAVAMLDAPAPERLHAAVAAEMPTPAPQARPARRRVPRPRWMLAGGLATALAATALALPLLVGSSAPTIDDTVELADRGASAPAPAVDPDDPAELVSAVGGVAFPNYSEWRRSGERSDEIGGRQAKTVYYRHEGEEVAYSIVAGEPLEWPAGVRIVDRDGVEFRSLEYEGAKVVTWLRNGHTCVLSSPDAGRGQLLDLATWMGEAESSA